jgi:hypothetical protein
LEGKFRNDFVEKTSFEHVSKGASPDILNISGMVFRRRFGMRLSRIYTDGFAVAKWGYALGRQRIHGRDSNEKG